jgi:hypothetical protein
MSTAHAIDIVEFVRRSRAEQGLEPRVSDPSVLGAIGAIFVSRDKALAVQEGLVDNIVSHPHGNYHPVTNRARS